ncbi:MAG: 4-(cytidine 5'-diphospho)-2-C-methyl-D-erythritol kinase [Opitutaceae bacterium]
MTEPAPAKINLLLAITGRREDGYHELVSLVAPLVSGDRLSADAADKGRISLECDDPAMPVDAGNLVIKAAEAFRQATGWAEGVRFHLSKAVPVGAGLGGGSSDAAAALRLLNARLPVPLPRPKLAAIAASVGSDCPLFLEDGPVVMRGRGERIEALASSARARLSGRRLVLFKPGFAVSTAWAYRRLAELGAYEPAAEAERRLSAWLADGTAAAERLLFNNLELPVFAKFPALPLVLGRLRERFGLEPRMSGSGSACFAFLPPAGGPSPGEIEAVVKEAWGAGAWFRESALR